MSAWWIVAAATVGLAAGPAQRAAVFATAVPAGQSRRHHCPDCGQPVLSGPRQLFSPSWVTGRCPHCGSHLALPPLAPELVTAGVFALLAIRARSVPELAALCMLAAGGIALACIDIRVRRLPDLLTLPLYLGLIGLLVVAAGTGHQWRALHWRAFTLHCSSWRRPGWGQVMPSSRWRWGPCSAGTGGQSCTSALFARSSPVAPMQLPCLLSAGPLARTASRSGPS
jgi:hypothetical protein